MLSYLRVRGLALLDDVTLELSPGLNVLTGETGAGKSIIVDALALLRGARGKSELIRSGDDAAVVDAQLDLGESTSERIAALLTERGVDCASLPELVQRKPSYEPLCTAQVSPASTSLTHSETDA